MEMSAFEQACLEARRLVSLSESLQDHMEDDRAGVVSVHLGALDAHSDLLLNLVSGIHLAGSRIVELTASALTAEIDPAVPSLLDPEFVLASQEMLMAVAEVSQACELLNKTTFAQEIALPDFELLIRTSNDLMHQLQGSCPDPVRELPEARLCLR